MSLGTGGGVRRRRHEYAYAVGAEEEDPPIVGLPLRVCVIDRSFDSVA